MNGGATGTGIAQTAIQSGFTVTLRDISPVQLDRPKVNRSSKNRQ